MDAKEHSLIKHRAVFKSVNAPEVSYIEFTLLITKKVE